MSCCRIDILFLLVSPLVVASGNLFGDGRGPGQPPKGPFGYSRIQMADEHLSDIDFFFPNETCGVCHDRHAKELQGSLHSAAHTDPLYRAFAELARDEAGDEVYAFCSGCHSSAGVVSRLIPRKRDAELPAEAKAGVTCDVCHQISRLTGLQGPWKEPGNASFVLEPGRTKFGHSGRVVENRSHVGAKRDFFANSEFCASCHTVIHPVNGLRIEHTYGEWKSSVYAKNGIQCQDCHMRRVEDALKVAETLRPVIVKGRSAIEGPERQIFPHYFVGGNANADVLADGKLHAQMAEKRLKSAARLELNVPSKVTAGEDVSVDVLVQNVAAGHNLPTGVTELRQMWVDVQMIDQDGKTWFRESGLDEHGDFRPAGIWFGAIAGDKSKQKTYKLWEMTRFLAKRTIPPKSTSRHTVTARVPANLSGKITIEVKLLYRSAPPRVVSQIMKRRSFTPKVVEMSTARADVAVE